MMTDEMNFSGRVPKLPCSLYSPVCEIKNRIETRDGVCTGNLRVLMERNPANAILN
jgi:hypothetical protein